MITIKIATNGENLIFVEKPTIASGDKNTVKLDLLFCDCWKDYTITAVFNILGEETYYEKLLVNNSCIVPAEVLTKAGNIQIGLKGVKADGSEFTSERLSYKIIQGAGNGVVEDPTPDIYHQLLTAYSDINDMVTEGLNSCEEFKNEVDNTIDEFILDYSLNDDTGLSLKEYYYTDDNGNITKYWITIIPKIGNDGLPNNLKIKFTNYENDTFINPKNPQDYAKNNNLQLLINASPFNTSTYVPTGKFLIQDGELINTDITGNDALLCQMSDGSIQFMNVKDINDPNELIQMGVISCCSTFNRIIENGKLVDNANTFYQWDTPYQLQIISWDALGNTIILTSNGNTTKYPNVDTGLTTEQATSILLTKYNVVESVLLDGGGSTALVHNNVFINDYSDNNFLTARSVPTIICLENRKEIPSEIKKLSIEIGKLENKIKKLKSELYQQNHSQSTNFKYLYNKNNADDFRQVFYKDGEMTSVLIHGYENLRFKDEKNGFNIFSFASKLANGYKDGVWRYNEIERYAEPYTILDATTADKVNNCFNRNIFRIKSAVSSEVGLESYTYLIFTFACSTGLCVQVALPCGQSNQPAYRTRQPNENYASWRKIALA